QAPRRITSRGFELAGVLAGSVLVAAGLALVYQAKVAPALRSDSKLLNLNAIERREQLIPYLQFLPSPRERQLAATRIFEFLQTKKVPNVGALVQAKALTGGQVSYLKPSLVVRTPAEYQRQFWLWIASFFAVFYLIHGFWRARGFAGEQLILPALQLLTGIGLILMLALRDPLRDTMAFTNFAQSVVLGGLLLAGLSQVDFPKLTGKLSYIPLLGAVALSLALIAFGSGPGSSDAKVNLLGFQPVEAIKLLIVFFLAGYFARRWEFLRVLKETRPELAGVSKHVDIPRLEYLLPLVAAIGLTLVFFFLQKDLGPALITACVFLAMYAVSRGRWPLAFSGLGLMLAGFLTGYFLRYPRTVYSRVEMWLSPWDNHVRGGEQVVHALWAMASGGRFGTGLGLGDPDIMPAAHTDLILGVLGEEWGFAGITIVYLLYAGLVLLGLRIAMRARSDYAFFLALGLTLLLAFGTLLISGGVLGLTPLSGVVTPFLSYGGTAMLANFLVFAVLASLSAQTEVSEQTLPFRPPVQRLAQLLGFAAVLVLGRAAYVQVLKADATVGAGALTIQADGFRRFQYNPRLMAIAREIPRGTIFDRNGVALASSDGEGRHYPYGAITAHLLGDVRSYANWGAKNSSLVERDSMVRLQGYDDHAQVVAVEKSYTIRHDYRELVPLLRHRYDPNHPDVVKLRNRKRDVTMSIDIRLQQETAKILESQLKRLRKQKGAAVVLDPDTGDLLASVSYPWPEQMPPRLGPDDGIDELLDRARYGLYPPGSTFKIVTAMAALRIDPAATALTYECKALPDGRVGNSVRGWGRPIRDDVADRSPHGSVNMEKGTVVSCNAYYAQLGTYKVRAEALHQTATLLGINVANPNTPLS
ncbi:MAG: FtsW/RodA/SpoVE family cell cycle protein, partial [Bryobacteraceae bacterium]